LSVFAISDLHLSLGTNKPMDIFGWDNHVERVKANWLRLIKDEDTVILPGDLSWALKIEEALPDFKFLDALPGRKILLKGNHDLWWVTMKKNLQFFAENDIKTIEFLYNDAAVAEGYAIAGTRGWLLEGKEADKKIISREVGRLRRSLEAAKQTGLPILTFLHYPPVYGDEKCDEILELLYEYKIDFVYHGHVHGKGYNRAVSGYEGIGFKLISCDCIDFIPYRVI
jgi:predicted phosphohydrolase